MQSLKTARAGVTRGFQQPNAAVLVARAFHLAVHVAPHVPLWVEKLRSGEEILSRYGGETAIAVLVFTVAVFAWLQFFPPASP